jgi:trimeric autotransporter adhesin
MKTNTVSLILISLLTGFALLQPAQAVVPSPDGGYPGFNTAEGQNALFSLTTGIGNTAAGWFSLFSNTDGSFNTALGAGTLLFNVGDQSTGEGTQNTALGTAALLNNTTGDQNTANGTLALFNNTVGLRNTAVGATALLNNTMGANNTAVGSGALESNINGILNTAVGRRALSANTSGQQNTAVGFAALANNPPGNFNTAVGSTALLSSTGVQNTAVGRGTLLITTTGNFNTALGDNAGSNQTTGSNNVYIGANIGGVAGENDACYIASIFGQTSINGIPVLINSSSKLGTTTSSKRFKEAIKPMDQASEALFALRPVSFRYKKDIDPEGRSQLGLVAEEVEEVNPDLVVRDAEGMPYSVRYDQVNAMLLNEFLKEHRKNEDQQAIIEQQQKQIDALTAGLQKVSAQLELSKLAPQTVLNSH